MRSTAQLIEEFRAVLRSPLDERTIVQARLMSREPYVFDGQPDAYAALRARIAERFKIHPHDTMMVGSAHLGFSIAPNKLWKPFGENSDIDMVIISPEAFVEYWHRLGGYDVGPVSTTRAEARDLREFKWHHYNGRIRPDLLPMALRRDWFDFFAGIPPGERTGLKVTGTIFFDEHFFEQYHMQNLKNLRARLQMENQTQ